MKRIHTTAGGNSKVFFKNTSSETRFLEENY
jgi:hypothetical protein